MTDIEERFAALVAELRQEWTSEDIHAFYMNGDWPSIALGQEFNTLLELAEDDADTLLTRHGIHEEEEE